MTVQAYITAVDDARRFLKADGFLAVDGRIIYQMTTSPCRADRPAHMKYSRVYLDAIGYELPPVVVSTDELEARLRAALRRPCGCRRGSSRR